MLKNKTNPDTITSLPTMTQQELYQKVTDRILEIMSQGRIPWNRPWTGVAEDGAISYVTRQPYSFLNQILVGEPGEYLTMAQVKKLGGHVKKGAKARIIVFYKNRLVTDTDEDSGEETLRTVPYLEYFHVFNLNQTEGIASKLKEKPAPPTARPDALAEEIISKYLQSADHPAFQNDQPSNRAFYNLTKDLVVVPMLKQYAAKNAGEYYSTTFHELVHSTGKNTRLNRVYGHSKSDPKYAYEELVAEIGAAMLCNRAGTETPSTFKNSAAYLQSWMQEFRNDPKLFVQAAAKAEKAAMYILGEYKPMTEEEALEHAKKEREERRRRAAERPRTFRKGKSKGKRTSARLS